MSHLKDMPCEIGVRVFKVISSKLLQCARVFLCSLLEFIGPTFLVHFFFYSINVLRQINVSQDFVAS